MTRNGWWVLGGVLAALVVLAGGWFVGVSPALAAADAASQNTATTQAQNDAMRIKLAALSRTAAKQGEMEAEDAVLQKAVPSILKPNTFSRRVYEVAALQGVEVDSWALGTATSYTLPASLSAAAAPAVASTATASASPSASASASPSAAASAAPAPVSTAPALAKTDPLITSANFTVVPTTITVIGPQDAVLRFASAIQDDERLMLVNSLTTQKNDDGTTSGGLAGYVYTLKR